MNPLYKQLNKAQQLAVTEYYDRFYYACADGGQLHLTRRDAIGPRDSKDCECHRVSHTIYYIEIGSKIFVDCETNALLKSYDLPDWCGNHVRGFMFDSWEVVNN